MIQGRKGGESNSVILKKKKHTLSMRLMAAGSLGGHGVSSSSSNTGFRIALSTSVADSIFSWMKIKNHVERK